MVSNAGEEPLPRLGEASASPLRRFALICAPGVSLLFLAFADLDPSRPAVTRTAAVAIWMAIWWMTEAVPLAVTALLPVVLYPLLGIMKGKGVAPLYCNDVIFLFIGGFLVALAMEAWGLHRRIALRILLLSGMRLRSILLGFMGATAFLSMWISNTATAMMIVPIAIAVLSHIEETLGEQVTRRYGAALFLAVAYSASIGGFATLVGTPPNLSFVRILSIYFPNVPEISFGQWFFFALPLSLLFLGIVWGVLSFRYLRRGGNDTIDREILRREYRRLGPIRFEETVVLIDFILLALLWIFRKDIRLGGLLLPGWSGIFPESGFLTDGTVAIAMSLLLFFIPAKGGGRILTGKVFLSLPWDIVLLFGGGFALASGFKESGLSSWIGQRLSGVEMLHPLQVILLVSLATTFLTELTSNTATAEMLLPILAALSVSLRVNPLLLMIPATLSCSCAFMLPVATPPNAIVFGSGRLRIGEMARAGLVLNLVGTLLIALSAWFLLPAIFGFDPTHFPEWAVIAK